MRKKKEIEKALNQSTKSVSYSRVVNAQQRPTKKVQKSTKVQASKANKAKKVQKIIKSSPITTGTTDIHGTQVEKTISLPNNMSKRAVEKSLVYLDAFERHFGKSIYRITNVTAICFIIIGLAYSAANYVTFSSTFKAETITAVNDILNAAEQDVATSTTNNDAVVNETPTVEEIGKTEFNFLNSVPDNLEEPFAVSFLATNVRDVAANLVIKGSSAGTFIQLERISTDKYKLIIPANSLQPNYYVLRIVVKPLDGSTAFVRNTNVFFAGTEEAEKLFNGTPDPIQEISSDDRVDSEVTTVGSAENVSVSDSVNHPEEIVFSLNTPSSTTLYGVATVGIIAPDDLSYVELYARPVNSITPRFVTLGTKRMGHWVFIFDSKNIPNGFYDFTAKTKYKDSVLTTRTIRLSVVNKVVSDTTSKSSTPIISIVDDRPLMTESEPIDSNTITTDDYTSQETALVMKENEEDLNSLMKRYAVARQTNDESLLKTVQEEIQLKREGIIFDTLSDKRRSDISDGIESKLTEKITDLQNRIDTFEELRRERSTGTSSVDTDSDGIADLDEIKLYGTSPTQADTDNDGVTDGIEIMRGYDPNDEKSEAPIRFESPKETIGLMRNDVLQISEVLPVINDKAENEPQTVTTEIRGKGLPNSFVTLYIFSTPTVITVKTDADGTFIYTYEKELEDGQHDVFVAMTDNAGEIIAQSNQFSFIKEAQAFTPLSAATESVVTPLPVTEDTGNGYGLAIGVGILAFGLILLMLGFSLRRNESEEIIITEKSVTHRDSSDSDAS